MVEISYHPDLISGPSKTHAPRDLLTKLDREKGKEKLALLCYKESRGKIGYSHLW
jgi:hypothetical protein